MSDDLVVPEGWTRTTLGKIGRYLNGRAFKTTEWSKSGRPIIRIQDLTGSNKNPNLFEGEVEDRYVVRPGDFLISWSATLGAYIWNGPEAVLNQHIFKVESDIDRKFHYHLVRERIAELERNAHGSGMVHVTKGIFDDTLVAVPDDLEVQRQLVGVIDRADALQGSSVAHLAVARRKVERFRQAVLAAACSGRLTADWRSPGFDFDSFEREMGSKRSALPARLRKPLLLDEAADLSDVPDHWRWMALDQLTADPIQNGLYLPASRYGSGTPILRIDDFQLDTSKSRQELKLVTATDVEQHRYALRVGDLVINRVNSPSHLGKSLYVEVRHVPAVFESNMMRLRVHPPMNGRYVNLYLSSLRGRQLLTRDAKWAVNQASINQTDVRRCPVPVPPPDEQEEIIRRVDQFLQLADGLRSRIDAASKRVDRSSQVVLAKAFRGELLPSRHVAA